MNRKVFYEEAKTSIFNGVVPNSAVTTLETLMDEWERRKLSNLRWLAYMMATAVGEVGRKLIPVREGFKSTDAEARAYVKAKGYPYAVEVNGHVYYGRGLVQLTWARNYQAMGEVLGINLYDNPDLALVPKIAVQIMFEGMIRGTFTGKKLGDYFNADVVDWDNARRIINGIDRAKEIGGYGMAFYKALGSAAIASDPTVPLPPIPGPKPRRCNFVFFGGLGGQTFSSGGYEMINRARSSMPWVDYTAFYDYKEADTVIKRIASGWSDPTYIGAHSFGLPAVLNAVEKYRLKVPGLLAIDSSQYWRPPYVPEEIITVDNYYQTSWIPFAIKGAPLYRQDGTTRGITNTKVNARHTEMTHLQVVQDAFVKMMNGAKP